MSRELPVYAPKPEEFYGNQIVIPDIKGVQYLWDRNGTVISPGTHSISGITWVRATALGGYYLNNEVSRWRFGREPFPLDISISLYRLEGGIFTITGDEVFDYVYIKVGDRVLTENPSSLSTGEKIYEVFLKNRPSYEPEIKFNTDKGVQDSFIRFGGTPEVYSKLEISREGTLVALAKLSKGNTELSMNIELREVYPEKPYELDLSPEIRLLDRTSVVLNEAQFGTMFNLTFNGKKITGAKTIVEKTDRIRIHAKLLDPYFVWDDTHPVRSTSIQVGGTIHFFERQADGSELLDIPWPENYFEVLSMILLARGNQAVKHVEIRNPDPYRVQGTNRIYFHEHYPVEYVDRDTGEIYPSGEEIVIDRDIRVGTRANPSFDTGEIYTTHYRVMTSHISYNFAYIGEVNRVVAPKPTQNGPIVNIPNVNGVLYYDTLEGEELKAGGYDLRLRRHERMLIMPLASNASFVVANQGVEWGFDNIRDVNSVKPTQDRNTITIPSIVGVRYVNLTAGGTVSGSFTIDEDITIEARPDSGYKLISPVNKWTFIMQQKIRATKPGQELNKLSVPVIENAEYYIEGTNEVISGSYTLTRDITVKIRELLPGTLINPSDAWDFKFFKSVAAETPVLENNKLTIPEIYGVQYFNKITGVVLTGEVEIRMNTTVGARQTASDIIFTTPDIFWDFEYQPLAGKKIIEITSLKNVSSIRVDWEPLKAKDYIDRLIVINDTDNEVRLNINLSEGYSFNKPPYILEADGTRKTFSIVAPNAARLMYSFKNLDIAQLVIPATISLEQELRFIGRNTTLEYRVPGGPVQYLKPGGTASLKTNGNYIFTVVADTDYEFDRDGRIRHDGLSTLLEVDKGSNKTRASGEIFSVKDSVEVELVAVYLGPNIPDPGEPDPDGPTNPEEPFDPVEPLPGDPNPGIPGDPNQPVYPGGPSEILGFNHVYLVDKDILTRLSIDIFKQRRQYIIKGSDITGSWDPNVYLDPHTYIINTIQLPFAITRKDVGRRERIKLGFTDFRSTAITLIRDKIRVDLGTIKAQPKYNNAYDYKNTATVLHLPYTDPLILDPNYVIDEDIDVEYIVDVYTGETTINLKSTLSGNNVFLSKQTTIGNVIPFVTVKDATTIGSPKESRTVKHNNVLTPYIEVIRNTPHDLYSQFNNDTTLSVDNLHNTKGRIAVHDILLSIDTTKHELQTIKSILASGITIQ